MENEERILELLAETLQRIDRHNEEIERLIPFMVKDVNFDNEFFTTLF